MKIEKEKIKINFWGKVNNKDKVNAIGTVVIRIPLPAHIFFHFTSLLIANDVTMLVGLSTQKKLRVITVKNPLKTSVYFKDIGITIPFVFKFGHLYCEGPITEYLFSTM